MTTRHENELREIERMMRNPGKSEKVTPAMMEHVRVQRQLERDRDERTAQLGRVINLSWAEGEPKKWDNALAVVEIGNQTRAFMVEPYEEIEGKQRLKPRIVTRGYKGLVEDWALWKWHTDRGSECDDNGHYILDCEPPTFVWAKIEASEPEPPKARAKPGPKPKAEVA